MVVENVSPKVNLITEIGNNWKKLTGKTIDSDEFDYLYDQSEEHLQYVLRHINVKLNMMASLNALEEFLTKLSKPTEPGGGE
jgi:hypothetical protein